MKLFTPESWERLSTDLANTRETGIPYTLELETIKKDGSNGWMWLRGEAEVDSAGKTVELWGAAQDITERKRAEEALRESETRFKALHNASFGGIAIHDQGIILECNQGLSEMTGYQYSELIGMNGLLLIAERSRKKIMNNIRTGYEKPYEAFGLRKNGEEFLMQLEARNVPYKGKQVRTVEFRDITERKLAEEALRESENKFRSLVEQAAEMLFLHDLKGNFIDVNLAATKNTGYSKEELRKMTVFNIDPDARDRDDMRNYWESLKIEDPPVTFEVRHRRKNGSVYSQKSVPLK